MLLPPGAVRAGSAEDAAVGAAWTGSYEQVERALRRTTDPELRRWLTAYLRSAAGSFVDAVALAEAVARAGRSAPLATAAAITAGAAHRQLGRYAEARRWDTRALTSASHPWERANALIGLAADAIGRMDADACATTLASVEQIAGRGVRAAIRGAWVRCEWALLRSEPEAAVRGAREALFHATASGARRHIAKSTLFLGVALDASGDPAARETLANAERLASRIGARAIATVARQMLSRSEMRPRG